MTLAEAEALLAGTPLVNYAAGTFAEMRDLAGKCLALGIPVIVGCPSGKRG